MLGNKYTAKLVFNRPRSLPIQFRSSPDNPGFPKSSVAWTLPAAEQFIMFFALDDEDAHELLANMVIVAGASSGELIGGSPLVETITGDPNNVQEDSAKVSS